MPLVNKKSGKIKWFKNKSYPPKLKQKVLETFNPPGSCSKILWEIKVTR